MRGKYYSWDYSVCIYECCKRWIKCIGTQRITWRIWLVVDRLNILKTSCFDFGNSISRDVFDVLVVSTFWRFDVSTFRLFRATATLLGLVDFLAGGFSFRFLKIREHFLFNVTISRADLNYTFLAPTSQHLYRFFLWLLLFP